jgi:hypothetical protein
MKNKKALIIFGTILVLAGASYVGYRLYKKRKTTSGNPEKDNRNIIITKN